MGEFCGCSKKVCALSLGIALLVLLVIELIIIIALSMVRKNSKDKDIQMEVETFMTYLFGFGTVTLLGVIASLILIIGAIKMRKCLLIAWIICGILLALAYTVFLGITIFVLSMGDNLALIDLPFILCIIILTILAIIVVFGLKNEAE